MNSLVFHIDDKTQSSVKEKLLDIFPIPLWGSVNHDVLSHIRRRTINVTGEVEVRVRLQIWGKL